MQINSVIVYYAEPIEVFKDLKRFCKIKGLKYNTWKQRGLPHSLNGFSVEREPVNGRNTYQVFNVMGEQIKIQ